MPTRKITIPAGLVALTNLAFGQIGGPRSALLSYKFGKITALLREEQGFLNDALRPYVQESGALREDLTPEETICVQELLGAGVTIRIPEVTLGEILLSDKLEIEDDSLLPFLLENGVIVE